MLRQAREASEIERSFCRSRHYEHLAYELFADRAFGPEAGLGVGIARWSCALNDKKPRIWSFTRSSHGAGKRNVIHGSARRKRRRQVHLGGQRFHVDGR